MKPIGKEIFICFFANKSLFGRLRQQMLKIKWHIHETIRNAKFHDRRTLTKKLENFKLFVKGSPRLPLIVRTNSDNTFFSFFESRIPLLTFSNYKNTFIFAKKARISAKLDGTCTRCRKSGDIWNWIEPELDAAKKWLPLVIYFHHGLSVRRIRPVTTYVSSLRYIFSNSKSCIVHTR